jgi:hypothetical protein
MDSNFSYAVAYINALYDKIKSEKPSKRDICKMEVICATVAILKYEDILV